MKKTTSSKPKIKSEKITPEKPEVAQSADAGPSQTTSETVKSFTRNKWFIPLVILVALAIAAYYAKSFVVAATVNGEPISRLEIIRELENQQGKAMLDYLVTEKLILQEAAKQNVTIPDQEIQAEIQVIESNLTAQGANLDEALAVQGMTRQDLEKQIRLQKLVERLSQAGVSVTEEEVTAYIEANREVLPEATSEAELRDMVKQQLTQQKSSTATQDWLTKIKEQANIRYFVTYQ